MKITLAKPDLLKIKDLTGETYTGGSQEWYEDRWQKASGCGPVAACNLIWAMTCPQGGKEQYIELMRDMFPFYSPSIGGINTSALFSKGIAGYSAAHGLHVTTRALNIPPKPRKRPDLNAVREFIISSLSNDAPVAFLNRSNGTVSNLETWHWVTIIALDTETMRADVSDYGKILEIDVSTWLKTSILGGAFVYITTSGN